MAPKSKSSEIKENPFLPPPIDLDQTPLADKDYLIVDPKCKFDFFEFHFWLKEIFLDQSDDIFSNSLKFQAHYLPNQRAIFSLSGENIFTVTS